MTTSVLIVHAGPCRSSNRTDFLVVQFAVRWRLRSIIEGRFRLINAPVLSLKSALLAAQCVVSLGKLLPRPPWKFALKTNVSYTSDNTSTPNVPAIPQLHTVDRQFASASVPLLKPTLAYSPIFQTFRAWLHWFSVNTFPWVGFLTYFTSILLTFYFQSFCLFSFSSDFCRRFIENVFYHWQELLQCI